MAVSIDSNMILFPVKVITYFLSQLSLLVLFEILHLHFRLLQFTSFTYFMFRPKLHYASVVWNSTASSDAKKKKNE